MTYRIRLVFTSLSLLQKQYKLLWLMTLKSKNLFRGKLSKVKKATKSDFILLLKL